MENDPTMLVSAIVAMSPNRVIGLNGRIPWYLPADLKYFKKTTLGHHVIMGRKSFESIGRPLPKRTNVVITRDPFFVASNCIIARSVDQALEIALDNGETEAFIIGGGEIYAQSTPLWDRLYLTLVHVDVPGDTFFPEIDPAQWRQVFEASFPADEKNAFPYSFQVLERTF
jgi:dihydrofolate reductase